MQRNAEPSRARGGDGDAEPAGAGPRAPGHRHRQHGNAALLRGETVVRSSRPRAEDRMVGCISLNFTGMKRMASARKRSRSSGSSKKPTKRPRYVVCLENKGHRGSLETRKVYRALSDAKGERAGLVRIIDESGEDYLYPTRWFARVSVPAKAKKALERAGV